MSPSGPYRLASSVAVLLASPKLGAVKGTFLLCSKGTLSLCRVSLKTAKAAADCRALDYNTLIMFHPRRFLRAPAWLLAVAMLLPVSFAQSQRPLNHGDYDGWRSIVGQKLSNDGKFLVYGLFPQEGDGEVVIRNLMTGKEQREPAGLRPAPTPPTPDQEGPAPEARGAVLTFSSDSKTVVFSTFPPRAESDKAKKRQETGAQGWHGDCRSRLRNRDAGGAGEALRHAGEGVGSAGVSEGRAGRSGGRRGDLSASGAQAGRRSAGGLEE